MQTARKQRPRIYRRTRINKYWAVAQYEKDALQRKVDELLNPSALQEKFIYTTKLERARWRFVMKLMLAGPI